MIVTTAPTTPAPIITQQNQICLLVNKTRQILEDEYLNGLHKTILT